MPRYTFNPFTSNFDRVETGGGGGGDITITAGDGNSITADSFFMEGAPFKDIPVMDSYFNLGDFLIENRVWETPYVVDKSSTEGERGTFTTIQAAMDQAELDGMAFDNPRKILIRPSSTPYIEDLLIKAGSFLYADSSNAALGGATPLVQIQGNHSLTAIGYFQSTGISWSCATGDLFTGGSSFTIFMANNSNFVSSSGMILNAPNGAAILNWIDCLFSAHSLYFQIAIIVNTLARCLIKGCSFGNIGIQKGSGVLRLESCENIGGINQVVATNGIVARNCSFSGQDNPCIYGDPGGSCTVINCAFSHNSGLTAIDLNGPNNIVGCYTIPNTANPSQFAPINTTAQGNCQLGNVLIGIESDSDVAASSFMSYVRITDTSSPRSVTINPAFTGYRLFVYDSSGGASTNNITVASNGGELINGESSYIINIDYGSVELAWNGTEWNIISNSTGILSQTKNSTPIFQFNGNNLELDFARTTNLGLGSSYPSLTTGSNNISMGQNAMEAITSGSSNVSIGRDSSANLTTGFTNTVVGNGALSSQTNGNNSVAIGGSALFSYNSGNTSVAIGYLSLGTSISGVQNTAVGYQCLRSVALGTSYNTAVGDLAGFSLTTGEQNTMMGASVLHSGTSFSNCAAFGYQALNACNGDGNSAFGRATLVKLSSGTENSSFGYNSLFNVTTGGYNSCFGSSASTNITTGSYNSIFGYLSGNNLTTSDSSNICIGSQGITGDNNTIRIGEQGSGNNQQNRSFFAGITGTTVANSSVVGVDSNGQLSSLGTGTSGQVLTSTGTTSPTWQAPVTSNTLNSVIASGSAVSLASTTPSNVTSISLTAGTWLVSGLAMFGGSPTVSGPQQMSINTTSATHGTLGDNSSQAIWSTTDFSASNVSLTVPGYIITVGSTTNIYLIASGTFSGGSMNAYGRISAVKIN